MKFLIVAVFSALFFASQALPSLAGWREFYPFFHWSLFSGVARSEQVYAIVVETEEGERDLDERSFLPDEAGSSRLYWLAQELGTAYEERSARFERLRGQLERQMFSNLNSVVYSLRKREVNPAQYVRNREILHDEVLETFQWSR